MRLSRGRGARVRLRTQGATSPLSVPNVRPRPWLTVGLLTSSLAKGHSTFRVYVVIYGSSVRFCLSFIFRVGFSQSFEVNYERD